MTTPVLLVQGTHAWGRSDQSKEWWDGRSPFCAFLRASGFRILGEERPFSWDTDIDGIGWLKRRPHKKHINWESAGLNLYAYIANPLALAYTKGDDYVPIKNRNILAHSHGSQVLAYACASGLLINRLLTIGAPVREDMAPVYAAAKPNIAHWRHVYSDHSDRIQWFGTLFDGKFGIVRKQPYADVNVLVPAVAHSKLLNDPCCFELWQKNGFLDFLKGL
jgi:hypothetical protein